MGINWLGVVLAFIAGMAVAFTWYQEGILGTHWQRLVSNPPERSRAARTLNLIQLLVAHGPAAIRRAFGPGTVAAGTRDGSLWRARLGGFAPRLPLSATT